MGRQYPSIDAAAKEREVSPSTISRRLREGVISRDAEGRLDIPQDARLLRRQKRVRRLSETGQTEDGMTRLPFDMSQVEQVNALLGMLDTELRRRDEASRRQAELMEQALRLATTLAEKFPPPAMAD